MKTKYLIILLLSTVTVTLFAVVSCDKPENESKQYTLYFVDEEIDIEPQLIEYGKHATAPENPEREGYYFSGWFIDNGTFANEWDFETDIVTQDTTLYAKWETPEITWDYPIKPGTEEWKQLKSHQEKVDACQVPEDILVALKTEYLLDICLRYPLIYDILAFNSISEGTKLYYIGFNGIREYTQRDSAVLYLLNMYDAKNDSCLLFDTVTQSLEEGLKRAELVINTSIMEALLGCSEMQKTMTYETGMKVLKSLMRGYEVKCEYYTNFQSGFRTNLYARAFTLVLLDPDFAQLLGENNQGVFYSGFATAEVIDMIDKHSYYLLQRE